MHLADLISMSSTFGFLGAAAALASLLILLLPSLENGSRGYKAAMAREQARQRSNELPAEDSASRKRALRTGSPRILLVLVLALIALSGTFASGWALGMNVGEREGTRAVDIHADLPWQNAQINVVAGQKLSISAFGRWNNGPNGADYGPDGNGKEGAGVVAPSAPWGALVGRIGEAAPFVIGVGATVTANASGQLRLAMNDWPDSYSDNHGMMTVLIAVRDQ